MEMRSENRHNDTTRFRRNHTFEIESLFKTQIKPLFQNQTFLHETFTNKTFIWPNKTFTNKTVMNETFIWGRPDSRLGTPAGPKNIHNPLQNQCLRASG